MNEEKTNIMEQEEVLICECCNYIIDDDDYTEWDGRIICSDCLEEHTTICDCCGSRIWRDNAYSDENITVCTDCYEEHYTRCSCCDALLLRMKHTIRTVMHTVEIVMRKNGKTLT